MIYRQSRYFCIRDHGQKLIYYAEKPVFSEFIANLSIKFYFDQKIKDIPKGVIEIKDISDIWKKNKTEYLFFIFKKLKTNKKLSVL